MKIAKLSVNFDHVKQANRLIFGHFIEFMRDCIDDGMWAQILKDRGFDRKKDIPEGVVDGNPNVAANWYRTGYKNSFEITMDSEQSLAKDGFSQKIKCFNDYDGYVGVAQGNLYMEPELYEGYVWAKAEDSTSIIICIRDEDGQIFYQQSFEVKNTWEKQCFSFQCNERTRNGVFEIRLLGEGTLWLDATSLMPCDTIGGIWKEVYRHIKELNPPVIRFPGGCFADCYHWEDGIGARDTRPYRMNRHWGGFEDNSFGTDEYMEFCKNIGCEPMICVNFGSGTPQEAAAWVEYCNGSTETWYGQLRAQNGHPEPYGIKYWDIGNETFGDWEIGHCSAKEYAEKYLEFYHAMKEKDDSIIFMMCGGDGDSRSQEWNSQISQIIGKNMDVVCLHMYALKAMEGKHYDNKEIYYAITGSIKKYEEILVDSWLTVRKGNETAKVAVTEYNMGSIIDSYREQTLEAAIFNGGMMNMFLRNTEKISMCNISDLVNGWPGGCIVSKNGHAYGTATYYVMKMYSEINICKVLESTLDCPKYDVTEQIGNIEPMREIPYGDIVVCKDVGGRIVIFAINRTLDEEMCIQTGLSSLEVEIAEIYSEKASDMNQEGDVSIVPTTRQERLPEGEIILKAHSVNRIIILKSNY